VLKRKEKERRDAEGENKRPQLKKLKDKRN